MHKSESKKKELSAKRKNSLPVWTNETKTSVWSNFNINKSDF